MARETEYNDSVFWDGSDLNFDFELMDDSASRPEQNPNAGKVAVGARTFERHTFRRAMSEAALENAMDWHLQPGYAYHVISAGDVDSLSYLKLILRQQPLEYCLISTWCMAITDAEIIESYLRRGFIKRMDLYVGEIFRGQYGDVYDYCAHKIARRYGGRICTFRNHSKVIAGFGRDFDFAAEGSANMNTNPRTEQTTITATTEAAKFYKDYYDGIVSFNRDFDDWTPYRLSKEVKNP